MGHGIPPSKVQYPECHQITLPHQIPLSAERTHPGVPRYFKVPGRRSSVNTVLENHVDRVTKEANSMLGFLRRNLKSTSVETKTNAYFSMDRPNLEYCSSVWNPHQKDLIYKVEMIPRRAARYVSNRYRNTSSVSSMLDALQWESLESRRTKIQLTLLFKIINEMVDIRADDCLIPSAGSTRRSHSKKLRQISTRTDSYKFSFSPVPFLLGIPFQHQSLRPLLWYLTRRGYPPYPSKQC